MKKKILTILVLIILISNINIGESQGASLYPHISYNDIKGHWAEEAILDTSGLGYMMGASKAKFLPDAEITYVELYTVLIKIMDLEDYSQTVDPNNWIESTYKVAEDMKLIEGTRPNPRARVAREEAAYLLGKALRKAAPLGDQIKEVKKFKDYGKFKVEKTPFIELVVQEGYMSGNTRGEFNPKAYITRGQIAQIISSGKSTLTNTRNIIEKRGRVAENQLGQISVYNVDHSRHIYKYGEDGKSNFPVYKEKNLYNPSSLEIGNMITYYIDGEGSIIYAKVNGDKKTSIEATVETIDISNRRLTVLDFRDKKHEFKIDEYLNMEELYFGQEVVVHLQGDRVENIETVEEEDPEREGYIIPGSKARTGKVLFASLDTIELQSDRGREKFQIDPLSTILYKKGKMVELFQLKEGDRVLLSFDDIYSSSISEIKIEDEEKQIAGILKGEIELVDQRNKEILLKDSYKYIAGQWQKMDDKTKVKLGTGEIYQGAKKINLSSLDKMKGQQAYIAFENNYGSPSIAKMNVKSGSSMEHRDQVQDIDYGGQRLVLSSNSFNFHGGTIVVKNNRLVDTLNLEKNQSLYLGSDFKNGLRAANFISVEGTSPMDERIDKTKLLAFKGKIEDIGDYKVLIGEDGKSSKEFLFTEDTIVYDSQLGKAIPIKAFKDSGYIDLVDIKDQDIRDRLEDQFYKNKMAYIVSKEIDGSSEVLGLNIVATEKPIYKEEIKLDYSTKAKIGSVDQPKKTIKLKEVWNYNSLISSWENAKDEEVDMSKTVVILNDQAISLDQLYKIRNNTNAYLVRERKTSSPTTYILIVED